ncbi:MAG: efflux RND transporter permease subunit [Rhodothermaceae bacterium]
MKTKFNLIETAMKYKQITLLITAILIIFGIAALVIMPRQEFPIFTIREGLIIGVYPGASSEEVEEQLTDKVEKFLFEFEEIDRAETYSISKEGMMIIFAEVQEGVKEPDIFWSKIKHGLNELKQQQLPPEVLALFANSDFGETSAVLLTIQSEKRTYKELEDYLEILDTELRKLEEVSKIKQLGLQKEKIGVYLEDDKFQHYNFSLNFLLGAIKTEGPITYAGDLDDNNLIYPIHVPSRYKTENDIAEQIIYTDPTGSVIRMKDIATIVREYDDPDSYVKYNGAKSLVLSLEMHSGNNIVAFGDKLDEAIEKAKQKIPDDIVISKIANQPKVVYNSVMNFFFEFFMAILAVIIVTMLLLPLRVASVAGFTIPISILISMGFLFSAGIELNTVTLAALIVVLGMVVDNSIVVIDNYVEKLDHGVDIWEAAWKSSTEMFVPVFTATLAIVSAFAPLAIFLNGMSKDFILEFPVTVAITLGTSLLVAILLVPYMNFVLIKKGLKQEQPKEGDNKKSLLDKLQNYYNRLLDKIVLHPKFNIMFSGITVVLAIIIASQLPRQLFPQVERDQFAVEIYLKEGSSLTQTDSIVSKFEKILLNDSRVKDVTSFVGSSSPRFHTVYAPKMPSKNYAQMIVNTTSKNTTVELLKEYNDKYSEAFPNAHLKMKQLHMLGSDAPIEVRITGENISEVKLVRDQIKELMQNEKGITWIRDDFKDMRNGIRVDVREDEANRLGFTKAFVAYTLAMGMKGIPIATIWEGDYPIDVVLKKEKNDRDDYGDIRDHYISSPIMLSTLPARQIVNLQSEWTEGQIVRRNGERTLTLKADVDIAYNASRILDNIKPLIDKLELPRGVNISYGGELEEEFKNYTPMAISLGTSVFLIFFIILFQFKNIKLTIIIMTTMPLSLFGAVIGLLITGYPFGFTAFMGIMSLCGMVVRNGIILVDYAEEIRNKNNLSFFEAAVAAGKRRMRPIFLTAAAAAIGVVPMIFSGSPLWGPLGTVIFFGLSFSLALTLLILPVIYYKIMEI